MKVKTVAVAVLAGSIGYVLGTRAGRDRFEQIRERAGDIASDLASSPQVANAVGGITDEVKKSSRKLPDPVADVVGSVADSIKASAEAKSNRARGRQ
jgi:hypothetical protein